MLKSEFNEEKTNKVNTRFQYIDMQSYMKYMYLFTVP